MARKYGGMVIGCGAVGAAWETYEGRVAPRSHAGALAGGRRTSLEALVDTNLARLREAGRHFPSARLYRSAARALKVERTDIVTIATPPETHAALAMLAARAGARMIICEKPLALRVRDGVALARELARLKVVFVLNFQRRFWPLFERVRAEIAANKFGPIRQVTCYYDNGLHNTGAHALDAALYLLDDRAVRASGLLNPSVKAHPRSDPDIDGIVETESGARIVLQGFDKTAWGLLELRLYGKKGAILVTEHGYAFEWRVPGRRQTVPVLLKTHSARRRESFVEGAYEEAIRCYEQKTTTTSGITAGLEVLAALDALVSSARKRGAAVNVARLT